MSTEPKGLVEAGSQRITLTQCPKCGNALVGVEERSPWDNQWDEPMRVWPSPPLDLSLRVPGQIRLSLYEAYGCLNDQHYTASVVMTGRALEAMCRHLGTESPYLGAGIEELHRRGVIDGRLYEWSQQLHLYRNQAAHADPETIKPKDAQDLFDFAIAICEYVFVLSNKFSEFIARKTASKKTQTAT